MRAVSHTEDFRRRGAAVPYRPQGIMAIFDSHRPAAVTPGVEITPRLTCRERPPGAAGGNHPAHVEDMRQSIQAQREGAEG
jgi:hypothetical protein